MSITWEVTNEVGEELEELLCRLENHEISEDDFAEELALSPGYPLNRLPTSADDFKIVVRNTRISSSGKRS